MVEGRRNEERKTRRRRRFITKSPSASQDIVKPITSGVQLPPSTHPGIGNPEISVIEGENGTIKVNGKVRAIDENFKHGEINIRITQGCISVNDDLIFKKKPSDIYRDWITVIGSHSVTSFKIEIPSDGKGKYTDNRGVVKDIYL